MVLSSCGRALRFVLLYLSTLRLCITVTLLLIACRWWFGDMSQLRTLYDPTKTLILTSLIMLTVICAVALCMELFAWLGALCCNQPLLGVYLIADVLIGILAVVIVILFSVICVDASRRGKNDIESVWPTYDDGSTNGTEHLSVNQTSKTTTPSPVTVDVSIPSLLRCCPLTMAAINHTACCYAYSETNSKECDVKNGVMPIYEERNCRLGLSTTIHRWARAVAALLALYTALGAATAGLTVILFYTMTTSYFRPGQRKNLMEKLLYPIS